MVDAIVTIPKFSWRKLNSEKPVRIAGFWAQRQVFRYSLRKPNLTGVPTVRLIEMDSCHLLAYVAGSLKEALKFHIHLKLGR